MKKLSAREYKKQFTGENNPAGLLLDEHIRQRVLLVFERVYGNSDGRIGRIPLLTPDLQSSIVAGILAGNYISTVCQAHNIHVDTLDKWTLRARDEDDPHYELYRTFFAALKTAEAIAEMDLLADIRLNDDPFAQRRWILERTRNARYSQRQVVELHQDITVTQLSVPDAPVDAGTWLTEAVAAEQLVGRLRPALDFDIEDAEVVPDAESLVRVEVLREPGDNLAGKVTKKPRKALRDKK